ncbi:MAG: ArsA family ATPase [Lachnospiraceae bacterium]|nr:ArsA family ATPase [Lachnospiraceae bacterium]
MGRIMIFTGKGGVGKTSLAAAHAVKAADQGMRTLLVSTDMAHNLGDLFQVQVGKIAIPVAEHLEALEIDPEYEMEHDFHHMMEAIYDMLPAIKGEDDNLAMIPGVEELFSLLKVKQIYESGKYDLVVVDCAPTGETLSLLKFPELASWYMEKFFPVGKIAMKVMRPISKPLFQIKLPNGKAMNDIEHLYQELLDLDKLLKDRKISSVRLVSMPEKMVVEESKRNYMYLNLYHFQMDGLYINRILPKEADAPFFARWHQLQEGYIQELEEAFGKVPICKIPWYDTDLNGMEALRKLAAEVLIDEHLFDVREVVDAEVYEKTEDGYEMRLYLPFVEKEEIELHEGKKEVILKIGNFKRDIMLPSTLSQYQIAGAKMQDQTLHIQFQKSEEE